MENTSYEGRLICVAGSDIDTGESVDSFFIDPQTANAIPVDNGILIATSQIRIYKRLIDQIQALDTNGDLQGLIDNFKLSQESYERLLGKIIRESRLSAEIIGIILGGRLNLIWLLNSLGGVKLVADKFRDLSEDVQENGGKVTAYVTTTAQSSAANIFSSSDERYVLRDSELMWHPGTELVFVNDKERTPDEFLEKIAKDRTTGQYREREQSSEDQENAMRIVRNFFEKHVLPEKRNELLLMFDGNQTDQNNIGRKIRLRGDQLFTYGLATDAFADVNMLITKFSVDTRLWPIPKNSALDTFFIVSYLEEIARVEYNVRIKFIVNTQSETATCSILEGTEEDAKKAMEGLAKLSSRRT